MRPYLTPLLVLVLTLTVFAGCLDLGKDPDGSPSESDGVPVAVLRCFRGPVDEVTSIGEMACNQQMTPHPDRTGNEVTIAVNPTNPFNIVGGAKDYYPPDAGECVWDGVYVTHDGGATYADRSFEGSPWRLRSGDLDGFEPNYASQFWCTTDPVAYFDVNGILYYLLMAYQADPLTGSKLGQDIFPDGALNDWAFNRAVQIIAISDDGGDSFHTFTPVLEGTYPVNFHDKGWIAASHDGTIHVMWLAFFVPGNQYCRSTDAGETYLCTEIVALQFLEAGQGSFLEVGTEGQVYAFWTAGGHIKMKRSLDYGETWGDIDDILPVKLQSMDGLSPRDRRTGYPMAATDRNPDSPFADSVYMVWNDKCQEKVWTADCTEGADTVYVAYSRDEGETWSEPVRITDDKDETGALTTDNWQFFPAISVSPGGVIDVSWMDTRNARTLTTPDGDEYLAIDQYYSYSLDGGVTWSENFRVRDIDDGGWDPALSYHQNGMVFIGDYNDIDSSWAAAHPVWPDTRHGGSDVYTAVIQRPVFADGWSETDRQHIVDDLLAKGHVWADHPFLER